MSIVWLLSNLKCNGLFTIVFYVCFQVFEVLDKEVPQEAQCEGLA